MDDCLFKSLLLPWDIPCCLWPIRSRDHYQPFAQNDRRTQLQPIPWWPPPMQKRRFQSPNQRSRTISSSPLCPKLHDERTPRTDLQKQWSGKPRDKEQGVARETFCYRVFLVNSNKHNRVDPYANTEYNTICFGRDSVLVCMTRQIIWGPEGVFESKHIHHISCIPLCSNPHLVIGTTAVT